MALRIEILSQGLHLSEMLIWLMPILLRQLFGQGIDLCQEFPGTQKVVVKRDGL
jgi:hypothetical protein